MMTRYTAELPAESRPSPEVVDRILVGLCAGIWLVLLGTSVAATVALTDLGRGFHTPTQNPHTGVLYIVIGVSVLIILAAIPVLLRARQSAAPRRVGPLVPQGRPGPVGPSSQDAPHAGTNPGEAGWRRTEQWGSSPHHSEVDRVLLRGVTDLTSVIGAGLIAVAAATYLMAIGKDTAAWVGYGAAGVITLAMPVVPWLHLRQLRGVLAPARAVRLTA